MKTLFSLYAWLVWVLHLLVAVPVLLVTLPINPAIGLRVVQAAARSAFFLCGIRIRVLGAERVDWSRAHVFMGNHQNLLDPFILVVAIPHHMVGIEKRENQRLPLYGPASRAWGNIPIDREDPEAARATIAEATDRLKQGTSIVILPEGTRTKDGRIGPFKKGGFHMALGAGADIVPFTFNGAYQLLRNGDWRLQPGEIELVFGEAIATEGYTRETLDDLVAKVREAVCANFKD
ncbi:1-acyl-sn-glycerol-3-phosphate acyltransferase [bacterium]|nr:1-acyl-sn-glycerol-3-phosphate acyltransferase [bacterium]